MTTPPYRTPIEQLEEPDPFPSPPKEPEVTFLWEWFRMYFREPKTWSDREHNRRMRDALSHHVLSAEQRARMEELCGPDWLER